MIIFKGVNRKPSYDDDLPPLATVEMSPKRSMTNDVFIKWLHHLGKFKQAGPVLLIFDGAKCHLHPDIVDVANAYEPMSCSHWTNQCFVHLSITGTRRY